MSFYTPRFLKSFTSGASKSHFASDEYDYLVGLRGMIVFQSFIFVFFQTFLPAALPDSKNVNGPLYQVILRKSFSVIFCNESLIYSWIIILSARTLCLPYLTHEGREVCASAIFRRCIRLWLPTFVAFSLAAAAFSIPSTDYINDFLRQTGNVSTTAPLRFRNVLIYFNSLFELFWITREYGSQAANIAFPSGTLWILSVLFQQSYTLFTTMVIIPHTRHAWRVKTFPAFIAAAYWVQSWAWYSITGLLIADVVLNMDFQSKSRMGMTMGSFRVPMWPFYGAMALIGFVLQFLFISWKPSMRKNELYGHTALYEGGLLNENMDESQPMARIDNYLIVLGSMLLVETFDWPQKVLCSKPFVALGRRSFSVFLVQAIVIYTAGIRLYLYIDANNETSHELKTWWCFCACAPAVALASEIFYRIVDIPSVVVAREFWDWMTK